MDENIDRTLELGVAFLIFLVGLGVFIGMQMNMSEYIEMGNKRLHLDRQVIMTGEEGTMELVTKDAIYFLLTDPCNLLKDKWDGDVESVVNLEVTIDAVDYRVVTDYVGEQSLRQALSHLTGTQYYENVQVNSKGQVTQIDFISK